MAIHIDQRYLSSKPPNNKNFGVFFSSILVGLALYAWYLSVSVLPEVMLACAVLVALCTIISPDFLAPLNKGWHSLGAALGQIMSPIVLGIIYFLLLTPIAWAGRQLGRDPLRLSQRDAATYWIPREQPSIEPKSFQDQF